MEWGRGIESSIREINKILNKYTKDNIKNYNLTLPRFHVLLMVFKFQPVNMGTLHEKMYLALSTLTVIVDYLVSDNLVKRYRDKEDRRVVLLEITPDGKEILNNILAQRQDFFKETMGIFEDGELNKLNTMLEMLLDRLRGQFEDRRSD